MKFDDLRSARRSETVAGEAFSDVARAVFASRYPEQPHKLKHELLANPLLGLDALAALGESLPETALEYNRGDLPIGVDGKPGSNGLTIGETIRGIEANCSWAVLKNIEQDPAYAALLNSLLDELRPVIEERTGRMMKMQGFIFVSSPDAVTPYHFDPEHNILMQLVGSKMMTIFPAGDIHFAPDTVHETYHTGGARELHWDDEFAAGGTRWLMGPGDAIYVPVMAPHHVKVGAGPSISLSITWRSEWSFEEADARAFNAQLRRWGLKPRAPGRWPQRNRAKAFLWRVWRKLAKA